MPRLVLLRHAEAADTGSGSDARRPLTAKGQSHAKATGEALGRSGIRPTRIVASPADRAWETAQLAAPGMAFAAGAIMREPRIYDASLHDLLTLARDHGSGEAVLVLVGHDPGFSQLATHLAGRSISVGKGTAVLFDLAWDALDIAGAGAPGRVIDGR